METAMDMHWLTVETSTFETEVDQVGHTRVVMGIHPYHFAWTLEKGDTFETPEVIMSYSAEGFGKLSQHLS